MPRDAQSNIAGDTGFKGMVDRLNPANLQAGEVTDAQNVRFRNGVAETRKGIVKVACYNNIAPEISNEINPWGEIHGVGNFSDSAGIKYLIMAVDGKCYYSRQNNNPIEVPLPTGLIIDDDVTFTQAFGKLLMHRGKLMNALVMSTLMDGFVDVTEVWDSSETYASGDRVCHGPTYTPSSLVSTGTTATITFSESTGYRTGMEFFVSGADQSEYNGRYKITESTEAQNTFTYTMASDPATDTATGTIAASQNFNFWEANDATSAGEEPGVDSKWDRKYDAMPNSESGVYIQNRLACATSYDVETSTYDDKVDVVQFSDVLDITKSYYNQGFQIDRGGHSSILDLHTISENQLLIFKESSVHVMTGVKVQTVNATFADSVVLETLIPNYGIVAPRAKATSGDDVYFFSSKRGVVSLKRNQQGKVHGVDIPLSEPIQKLVSSIDHRYYDKIRMAAWDNCLYIAAPRDNSYCDVCLVWDFITQSWSYYTGTAVNIKEFFTSKWNGRDRLFFTSNDGFINLMEEGFATDDVRDITSTQNINIADINFSLTTRGYASQDIDHRSYDSLTVNLETWNPKFTIKVKPDGVDEEITLCTDRTKSRTRYFRPFDAEPYDISNRDGTHNTAYREDYSVTAPNNPDAYLQTEAGDYIHLEDGSQIGGEDWVPNWTLSGTVYLDKMQEWLEKFRYTPQRGRYCQVTITNDQGRIKVDDVGLTHRSTGQLHTSKI